MSMPIFTQNIINIVIHQEYNRITLVKHHVYDHQITYYDNNLTIEIANSNLYQQFLVPDIRYS
jgi:hypothetical protein